VYAAEVVSLMLIPLSEKEITTDVKARINEAIYSGHTNKVSN
jgi:hypothetical protein